MDEQGKQNEDDRWRALGIRADVPHPARMYAQLLGGKDNISQVVPAVPYSGPTVAVQARQADYSKIASFAVRDLPSTCLGANVRFLGHRFLTLA